MITSVRPLCGHDEEWLYGLPPATPQAAVVVDLLARAGGATRAAVRRLTVQEGAELLLRLRAATYGDRVDTTLVCTACGEPMDVDFSLADLLRQAGTPARRRRLPTLGDVEDAVGAADPEAALRGRLSKRGESELARLAPLAGQEIEALCPECGASVVTWLDPGGWLLERVLRGRPEFEREVHQLCFHYHWALGEVLGLSRPRRRWYVGLLERQLDASYAGEAG